MVDWVTAAAQDHIDLNTFQLAQKLQGFCLFVFKGFIQSEVISRKLQAYRAVGLLFGRQVVTSVQQWDRRVRNNKMTLPSQ